MQFFQTQSRGRHPLQITFTPETEALRQQVRTFLADAQSQGHFAPQCDAWIAGYDPTFSRMLGDMGWLGMTWPTQYGGHERSSLERFVVSEELLAAGAPVAAHWIADRQTGPLLLRYGTEEQKTRFLPPIARGECYCGIGMSEPDSGSDLASIRSTAEKVSGGWRLNGRKVWTSWAHRFHQMVTLVRTSPLSDNRHSGMSQFLVDLSSPGLSTKPIISIDGEHHFNQVIFDDLFVPDEMVIGEIGNGWNQVIGELAFERSGPERILSTLPLLLAFIERIGSAPEHAQRVALGQIMARLWTLRRMSMAVAGLLEQGELPNIESAFVKDLGTQFEQSLAEIIRLLTPIQPSVDSADPLEEWLALALLRGPSFTLRGGTTEVLRGIIARGLGLR